VLHLYQRFQGLVTEEPLTEELPRILIAEVNHEGRNDRCHRVLDSMARVDERISYAARQERHLAELLGELLRGSGDRKWFIEGLLRSLIRSTHLLDVGPSKSGHRSTASMYCWRCLEVWGARSAIWRRGRQKS
jgi:hypothetical protein